MSQPPMNISWSRLCFIISFFTCAACFFCLIYWPSMEEVGQQVKFMTTQLTSRSDDLTSLQSERVIDAEHKAYVKSTPVENRKTKAKNTPDFTVELGAKTALNVKNKSNEIEMPSVTATSDVKRNFVNETLSKLKLDDSGLTLKDSGSNLHDEIDVLAGVLTEKIQKCTTKKFKFKPACHIKRYRGNSCDGGAAGCLQTELPAEPAQRVLQLVSPAGLRLTPGQHRSLRAMTEQARGGYDVILLTAASSNHYLESQALLKNLHSEVYPYLRNFTLIFYDIGLNSSERAAMEKFCKCTVLDFPFEEFPEFMSDLRCYSWKPVIIKSQLPNANVVIWADASVRFFRGKIVDFVGNARKHGAQIGGSCSCSPIRTVRSMYHFFGDEPCAYFCLGQAKATVGAYHRERFVERVILEPWVACALNRDCMCPLDSVNRGCSDAKRLEAKLGSRSYSGPIAYGLCHRFDQSAISLIVHKLYQENYMQILFNTKLVCDILRSDEVNYFLDM